MERLARARRGAAVRRLEREVGTGDAWSFLRAADHAWDEGDRSWAVEYQPPARVVRPSRAASSHGLHVRWVSRPRPRGGGSRAGLTLAGVGPRVDRPPLRRLCFVYDADCKHACRHGARGTHRRGRTGILDVPNRGSRVGRGLTKRRWRVASMQGCCGTTRGARRASSIAGCVRLSDRSPSMRRRSRIPRVLAGMGEARPRQQQALLTRKWPGDIHRQQEHRTCASSRCPSTQRPPELPPPNRRTVACLRGHRSARPLPPPR
jgi:hypothetical protein